MNLPKAATMWIDGVEVEAENRDGWVTVKIKAAEDVTGYAIAWNGRWLPTALSPPGTGGQT